MTIVFKRNQLVIFPVQSPYMNSKMSNNYSVHCSIEIQIESNIPIVSFKSRLFRKKFISERNLAPKFIQTRSTFLTLSQFIRYSLENEKLNMIRTSFGHPSVRLSHKICNSCQLLKLKE